MVGAWIAEWYNTGPWVQASVRTKLFQLKYNIYTQELSEEDEIKTGNTNINTIIG